MLIVFKMFERIVLQQMTSFTENNILKPPISISLPKATFNIDDST